jgi:hypothetical protein
VDHQRNPDPTPIRFDPPHTLEPDRRAGASLAISNSVSYGDRSGPITADMAP